MKLSYDMMKSVKVKMFGIESRVHRLHVCLGKGLHPLDGMPCHAATIYANNDQEPLTMLPCPNKIPNFE